MKILCYLGPLIVVLFARISPDGASQAETADNTLARAEKDAGWLLLFNGKNLDGWQTSSKAAEQDTCRKRVHQSRTAVAAT